MVVDTPGFNQPSLAFPAAELWQHFPEILQHLEESRWVGAWVRSGEGRQRGQGAGGLDGKCATCGLGAEACGKPASSDLLTPAPLPSRAGAPTGAASTCRSRGAWCGGRATAAWARAGGSDTRCIATFTRSWWCWRTWRHSGRPGALLLLLVLGVWCMSCTNAVCDVVRGVTSLATPPPTLQQEAARGQRAPEEPGRRGAGRGGAARDEDAPPRVAPFRATAPLERPGTGGGCCERGAGGMTMKLTLFLNSMSCDATSPSRVEWSARAVTHKASSSTFRSGRGHVFGGGREGGVQ